MKGITKTFAALTVAVLACTVLSCAKQRIILCADEENEIMFSVVENTTRSVTATVQSSLDAGFGIAAVMEDDNSVYFKDRTVKDGSVWKLLTPRYYIPGKTLSFYAVFPATQEITLTGGQASLQYDASGTADLVAGLKKNVSQSVTSVPVTMDHLLAMAVFTCHGEDNTAIYKVTSIKVQAPGSGTYTYSDGKWDVGEAREFEAVEGGGKTLSAEGNTDIQSMTFLPCEGIVTVAWECYDKVSGTLLESYEDSVQITLRKGQRAVINFLLPNNAAAVGFTVSMSDWTLEEKTVRVEKN